MDLEIKYEKMDNQADVYNKIKAEVGPMLEKFQVKADLEYLENEIKASGKGFDLTLCTLEDRCTVEMKLSFLLKPLKGQILNSLERQLKKFV